jgi:SAM-dependent methyltransferase
MKHYVAAAHALRHPSKPVLDLGSGTGHDLALLASFGLRAIGVEPSETMLAAALTRARGRRGGLVRAVGEALPFSDGAFGGCRIERVLMHVAEPTAVLREARRCVERDGLVTVLEPDHLRLEIASDVLPANAGWLSGVAHPGVGGELWPLIEEAGCQVLDRVEELSVWRSLATLEHVAGFPASVDRAVAAGRLGAAVARRWVEEQYRRDAEGRFEAKVPKVLIVARRS